MVCFKLSVAGMRVLHWCMLGVTFLLLMCEVAISQLCNSLITLVDGFHTLFILLCMALPPPPNAGVMKPLLSSLDPPSPHPHVPPILPAELSIEPLLSFQTTTVPGCGVSYTGSRIQPVGAFLSTLLLGSLCMSYLMDIISFSLEPRHIQRPLLLVVVGSVSLLLKMLLLQLYWDQLQDGRARVSRRPETKPHLEVTYKVFAVEETKGQAEPEQAVSGLLGADSHTLRQQPEAHLHAAAPQHERDFEVVSDAADLKASKWTSHSEDNGETSRDGACMKHTESPTATKPSPVCTSAHHTDDPHPGSQWPICPLSLILVIQGLFTSTLALVNSLVMLLIGPRCLHSSGTCSLLVYLDPGLSLLAVITLIARARPQMFRYGLLLLQAAPPHICVSDIEQRIVSVPGVRAVHDLHVWQLTESLMVASVHVHCHPGFPAHRCADLMLAVTKVLQSVGVSCCTVQPEFAPCSGSSAGRGGDASPVVHREDPSPPPLLACSLTCGKACTGSMCCSPLEKETGGLLAPPAGEIDNTFV
uniref:Cation efflux protein cytoplasmic domain-containing protein n=2 Tax=Monopterus albus TaxID=43700 RepID=A0A3Q3JD01_MONAL